ncbi:hypothetical protein ACHAWF_014973 [Thalassiosira exigua]
MDDGDFDDAFLDDAPSDGGGGGAGGGEEVAAASSGSSGGGGGRALNRAADDAIELGSSSSSSSDDDDSSASSSSSSSDDDDDDDDGSVECLGSTGGKAAAEGGGKRGNDGRDSSGGAKEGRRAESRAAPSSSAPSAAFDDGLDADLDDLDDEFDGFFDATASANEAAANSAGAAAPRNAPSLVERLSSSAAELDAEAAAKDSEAAAYSGLDGLDAEALRSFEEDDDLDFSDDDDSDPAAPGDHKDDEDYDYGGGRGAPKARVEKVGKKAEETGEAGESDDYGLDALDSLDDEALAALAEDEDDLEPSDEPKAESLDRASTGASTGAGAGDATPDPRRGYDITYNGEKRARPVQEELLDSSDDEDDDDGGKGEKDERIGARGKENRSPNKKKPKTDWSRFEKRSTDDDSEAHCSELLTPKRSPPSPGGEVPGSPSSLDTPRPPSPPQAEEAPTERPSDPPSAAERRTGPTPALTPKRPAQRKAVNPYGTGHSNLGKRPERPTDVARRTAKDDEARHLESDSDDEEVPSAAPARKAFADEDGPASEAVALPDLGINPNAEETELQRLKIPRSGFRPKPHVPGPDPIVHSLSSRTRPPRTRQKVPVDRAFSGPVRELWRGKFAEFNHVQSKLVQVLADSDDNVVVSAPTGSGKTALFEMAIARAISSDLANRRPIGSRKAVYIAPNKALCEERRADWSARLAKVEPRIVCASVTGDAGSQSYAKVSRASLILTTPEKWDSITRRWNEHVILLSTVKLLLVDEVHAIGEKGRGGCLEGVIRRARTIQGAATARRFTEVEIASSSFKNTTPAALASNMRIVAVSATLPNLGQIASFIGAGEAYTFDQSYRPVPLDIHVQACGHVGKNRYIFDKSLSKHVPGILKQFSRGRPAIVFCHSKKDTETLALELAQTYVNRSRLDGAALATYSGKTNLAALHRCLRAGVAFHHAGLDPSDRRLVEEAFSSGCLSCLCATSTLAVGVNLPAQLVVIKGTVAYRGSELGHQEIDTGTLLQMMGRAGRPGFDERGSAVIMTDSHSRTKYLNVSQGLKVVESCLMEGHKLTEVFNVEVSQGVITSVEEAIDWVKGSFLYPRIQKNPLLYGFNGRSDDALHSFVLDKCQDSIDKLRGINAISMEEDGTFSPTAGCHVMSQNFVGFDTMKSIVKLPHDSGPLQLLHMLANSHLKTQIRRDEKKHLNEAYKLIKYKLQGPQSKIRIQTDEEKAFVILQSAIGRHDFQYASLRQQMSNMIDDASQILSAVEQYAKEGSGHGQVATQAILLRRSLFCSLWGEKDGVLNQIGGVTSKLSERLSENGISTFADAMNSSTEAIEKACNVPTSFANSLRAAASKILQRTLKLSACIKEMSDKGLELHVKLERRVAGVSDEERVVSYSLLVFTDRPGGLLHYAEEITNEFEMRVQCPNKFGRAYVRLVSNLVGLDEQVAVDGNDKIQKSSFSLSPKVAKSSSTKGKTQSTATKPPPPSSRKRAADAHRNAVSNVSDLRLHKRGKVRRGDEDDDCVIIDPDAVDFAEKPNASGKQSSRNKKVTPSPHPRKKDDKEGESNLSPVPYPTSPFPRSENASVAQSQRTTTSSWSKNTARSSRKPRNVRSSWFREKKSQKTSQQTAFSSPKENPFARYHFDPNNIENSLDSTATRGREESIIPDSVANSTFSSRNTRHGRTFRTPANRRRTTASSSRISSVGLLQQKAAELQQHHSQTTAQRTYMTQPMQQNNMDAPSAHNAGYANDGHVMNHYGDSFQDPNQFMGPGAMEQHNNIRRPGTATGSVMQQSIGIASLSPPPMMGRGNRNMMGQGAPSVRGPMAAAAGPMTSGGNSIASLLRANNFQPKSYGLQRGQFPHPQNDLPYHDLQHQSQGFESFHGSVAPPTNPNPGLHHGMIQQQFDDTFDDPMCHGLDPAYDDGMNQFHDPSFAEQQNMFHDPSFANMSQPQLQLQLQHSQMQRDLQPNQLRHPPHFDVGGHQHQPQQQHDFNGSGHQFEGSHNASVLNPYERSAGRQQHAPSNPYQPRQQSQQQQHFPRNPYQQGPQPQQRQQEYHSHDGASAQDLPPMTEVVVQTNGTARGGGGPDGGGGGNDDASQFDDAFL